MQHAVRIINNASTNQLFQAESVQKATKQYRKVMAPGAYRGGVPTIGRQGAWSTEPPDRRAAPELGRCSTGVKAKCVATGILKQTSPEHETKTGLEIVSGGVASIIKRELTVILSNHSSWKASGEIGNRWNGIAAEATALINT